MKGQTGDVTAASVLDRVKTAKDIPIPLSGGITFTCDGTAIPLLKSVCSAATSIGVLNAKGEAENLKQVDPGPLFKT